MVLSMRIFLILLVSLLATACTDDHDSNRDDDPPSDPLSILALHAEPDIVAGGAIVDELNREVLLRGVNVNAHVEYWESNEFPTVFPFSEEDAELMATFGWNTVRLLLSWSLVEPAPGAYDEAYLDRVESTVEILARNGIYTIIDLHQDAWNATLAASDNDVCPENMKPALGWDGAPGWATLDDGQLRCTFGDIRESSPAVRAAWVAFWQDSPGPDGIGVRTRYAEMLGHISERFASHASVAGYDIMNEPNAFDPTEQTGLAALYEEAMRAIRAGETRAKGFSHLVFFEPSVLWSRTGQGPPNDFPRDSNVVYSPHIYSGGFDGGPITREAFQIAFDEAILFDGAPVLSGEWGSDPERAAPEGDSYFLDHLGFQDNFHFGSTLWTWRESCGDPHKTADYRAGRIPIVWGEFEVDCEDNTVLGPRVDLVHQLTRPALRAAPGRIDVVEYDPVSGYFRASGIEATGGELLVFYPISKHGQPTVSVDSGLGEVVMHSVGNDKLYLVAEVIDSTWSLELSP